MPTLEIVMQFWMRFFFEDFIQTSLKRHLASFRSWWKSFGGMKEHMTRSNLKRLAIHLESFLSVFLPLTFRVYQENLNVIFEIIKNRNPIFSGGFHANVIAIILDEPAVKLLNIRIDG